MCSKLNSAWKRLVFTYRTWLPKCVRWLSVWGIRTSDSKQRVPAQNWWYGHVGSLHGRPLTASCQSVRILWRLLLRVLRFCTVNIISATIRTHISFIYHWSSTRRIMLAMTASLCQGVLSLINPRSPFGKSNSYCSGAVYVSKYFLVGAGCDREGILWSHCIIHLCRKKGNIT